MDNMTIYKRTLGFSLRRLFWDFLAVVVLAAAAGAGFLTAEKATGKGLIGLGIGAVIGIVALVFILRYVSYTCKAGQIAMMTKGIVENDLPDDVIGEGKKIVKERFTTVALFFAATSLIKGIFNQLGRAVTNLGESVGGDTGGTVGSAVSSVVNVIVSYLCDCCLGWVFYRKEVQSGKATCEGAVLFFKHGKTLAKNLGRIFGIGLLSLLAVGGVFAGIAWLIMSRFPAVFERLAREFAEAIERGSTKIPEFLTKPDTLVIAAAVFAGIIIWSIIHSVFIRPFVLTGVLRNYINSGIADMPDEASFALLDSKSAKFKKLHAETV